MAAKKYSFIFLLIRPTSLVLKEPYRLYFVRADEATEAN